MGKRYCILFLYQYNKDNKAKRSRTEEDILNLMSHGVPASEYIKIALSAEYGGQTNGSI